MRQDTARRQAHRAAPFESGVGLFRATPADGSGAAPVSITHVFGDDAQGYINSTGLAAVVATTLNPLTGANGQTPETARHIRITPGTYMGDWYLGSRAHLTVDGDPDLPPPVLVGDKLVVNKSLTFTLRDLVLNNCTVGWLCRYDGPVNTLFHRVEQYGQNETRDDNGFANSNKPITYPQVTEFRACTLDGGGNQGNTTHVMYIEGRGATGSTLRITEGTKIYGANACSMVKSTTNAVEIKDSEFYTRSRRNPERTANSIFDIVAPSQLVITRNIIEMWRNADPAAHPKGLLVPGIHRRNRRPMCGNDMPAYPDIDRDPPLSSYTLQASSPGGGWGKGPDVYVSDEYWAWLEANYNNPEALRGAFVSYNTFRVPEDSRPVPWLRDDGCRPMTAAAQFANKTLALWCHPNFREPSITYHAQNTFEGAVVMAPVLNDEYPVVIAEPGACYPRTQPYHYPRCVEVSPTRLPEWFKQ